MQLMTSNKASKTMSSREIAEVVESRHDSVKRTMDTLQSKGLITITQTCEPTPGGGKPVTVYHVSKRDSYVAVAQLAPRCIGEIADFWGRTESTLNEILSALEAFDVPPGMENMYVYAMREADTGRIKLGISRDPEARLKQLQTGNSQRLELVAYRKASAGYQDEKELHLMNANRHIRGEWFNENARLEA